MQYKIHNLDTAVKDMQRDTLVHAAILRSTPIALADNLVSHTDFIPQPRLFLIEGGEHFPGLDENVRFASYPSAASLCSGNVKQLERFRDMLPEHGATIATFMRVMQR